MGFIKSYFDYIKGGVRWGLLVNGGDKMKPSWPQYSWAVTPSLLVSGCRDAPDVRIVSRNRISGQNLKLNSTYYCLPKIYFCYPTFHYIPMVI